MPLTYEKISMMSGIGDKIESTLKFNRQARAQLKGLLPEPIRSEYKDVPSITTAINEWLTGDNFNSSWQYRTSVVQRVMTGIRPWLNHYIQPTELEEARYVALLTHEQHHAEYQYRAESSGIINREDYFWYKNSLESIGLHSYFVNDSTNVYLNQLADFSVFASQRGLNKDAFKSLFKYYNKDSEYLDRLLYYSVFSGCNEVIAMVLTGSMMLNGGVSHHHYDLYNLHVYSPLVYYYPDQEWVNKWEDELTVDSTEIGKALDNIYNDLFDKGTFNQIFSQVRQKQLNVLKIN
jgi:hypothetical protein